MLKVLLTVSFLFLGILPKYSFAENEFTLAVITTMGNSFQESISKQVLSAVDKALSLKSKCKFFPMQDTPDHISQTLDQIQSDPPDLILVFGTRNLEILSKHPLPIPILFSMVYRTNLTDSIVNANPSVKGLLINLKMSGPLSLLKQISPELKKIGVIYSRGFFGNLVADLKKEGLSQGLDIVSAQIDKETDLPKIFKNMMPAIDAFYLLPDPLLLEKSVTKKIMLLSSTFHFFVFSDYLQLIHKGALICFVFQKREIVQKTSKMVAEYALTRNMSALQNRQCEDFRWAINASTAKILDISIPQNIQENAWNPPKPSVPSTEKESVGDAF